MTFFTFDQALDVLPVSVDHQEGDQGETNLIKGWVC